MKRSVAVSLVVVGAIGAVALCFTFMARQTPREQSEITAQTAGVGVGPLLTPVTEDPFEETGAVHATVDAALATVKGPVGLPNPKAVGKVVDVLQAGEGKIAIRYASGLTLIVEPRRDLAKTFKANQESRASGRVEYSDGQSHLAEERPPDPRIAASGGVEAYSVGGGDQLFPDGSTRPVSLQLYWNDAEHTYSLTSKGDVLSLDALRAVMRSSHVAP